MRNASVFIVRLAVYAPISALVWGLVSCVVVSPDWGTFEFSTVCGMWLGVFAAFLLSFGESQEEPV